MRIDVFIQMRLIPNCGLIEHKSGNRLVLETGKKKKQKKKHEGFSHGALKREFSQRPTAVVQPNLSLIFLCSVTHNICNVRWNGWTDGCDSKPFPTYSIVRSSRVAHLLCSSSWVICQGLASAPLLSAIWFPHFPQHPVYHGATICVSPYDQSESSDIKPMVPSHLWWR